MRRSRTHSRLVVLMAAVAVVGLGLAVLKEPYEPRISVVLVITIATLLAAARRAQFAFAPQARAWWFGFSVFGWAHLLLFGSGWRDQVPTTMLADRFGEWYAIHHAPCPTPMGREPW